MAAGELSSRQRAELDAVMRTAEQACRLEFSVFIGLARGDAAAFARDLHRSLSAPRRSVLVMVDPVQRLLEVVTGSEARRELTDHEVELCVLAMRTAFAEGDLVGGLKRGIAMLGEHAIPQQSLHAGE